MKQNAHSFWHNGIYAKTKLGISILLALAVSFLPFPFPNHLLHLMAGWDVFAFLLLSFYWISFYTTPISHIQKEAAKEDSSRSVIFTLILITIFISMLAVIMLIISKNISREAKYLQLFTSLAAMILSWFLLHTVFTVKYAHMYYSHGKLNEGAGLEFPEDSKPGFLDFAYYSFVLGMTFQVSDISITDKKIRRLTLLHSIISFGYNAVIIAITINLLAGLGD